MSTSQTQSQNRIDGDRNEDPITGEPGAHPIGTGVGAAGGAAAGAAIGAAGGPLGVVVGGAIGAVAGGLAGKGVAEAVDPTVEDAYWSENYRNQDYVDTDATYDDLGPAYRSGYEGYRSGRYATYDEAEPDLERNWDSAKGKSRLAWEKARHASRAAWDRVERALPGDADGDGK